MIFTKEESLLDCILQDENGLFVAQYKQLTLKSVFQPIYGKNLSITGLEALVRIYHDSDIAIHPDIFFHSRETELNDKLNVERLSRVIHIRNFAQSKYQNLQLFLNVLPNTDELLNLNNVSPPIHFKRLIEWDLPNEQIVLEMLELESGNDTQLKAATHSLASIGFNIAVDDFGVNASNKERVDLILPNIIKLDRSLMIDYVSGKPTLLENALNLAKKIGAKTVIEGIETIEQLNVMQQLNIDMFQGYFLARPEAIFPCTASISIPTGKSFHEIKSDLNLQ